jgi:hypothetical protein
MSSGFSTANIAIFEIYIDNPRKIHYDVNE